MEAIYAIDINNGLSKDGGIPWNSKKDLTFFENHFTIIGNCVI
jgi:dihydrofolate reductase